MDKQITEKRCKKCGHNYPATTEYFYEQRQSKDGLAGSCKVCFRARVYTKRGASLPGGLYVAISGMLYSCIPTGIRLTERAMKVRKESDPDEIVNL